MEQWLATLARKWERFFARDRQVPIPPERERAALERRLQEMSRGEGRSTAEQFRLDQLLHRYSTFNQLWQRQLRSLEEVGSGRTAAAAAPDAAAAAPVSQNGYDEVYTAYCSALSGGGKDASVNRETFTATLDAQRRKLEEDGAAVDGFEVVREAGKVKVRARVRRRRS